MPAEDLVYVLARTERRRTLVEACKDPGWEPALKAFLANLSGQSGELLQEEIEFSQATSTDSRKAQRCLAGIVASRWKDHKI